MNQGQQIKIFDTTLRDGQQCPGAGMSIEQNIAYAELATLLRVDVLEAGFPAASKLDFEIVQKISEEIASRPHAPTIAALCQLRDEQIDVTIEALLPASKAARARLHVYVPVAPALMTASLGEKADKTILLKNTFDFISRAAGSGLEVEFSPEGYSRMGENFDFVTDLIRAAVEAGVTVINCPDTIGGGCYVEGESYFVNLMKQHAEIVAREFPGRSITWSVHCHNDFGLAVQNSIHGVFDGPARQIEGCINGIGERAGNAALESVIMIIDQFGSLKDPGNPFFTNIDTSYLQEISNFVEKHMLPRQPHWPVSGYNAARHSSGGHTNAVLNDPLAYQPFDPRTIGKEVSVVFGPLSGGNHAKTIIEAAGYLCEDQEKAEIAQAIKAVFAERRKGITDAELLDGYRYYRGPIKITSFDYARSANRSEIRLKGILFDREGEINEIHEGKDSALAALKKLTDPYFPCQIQSHRSESDGAGIDAQSVAKIVIVDAFEHVVEGIGRDQDIEISALKAFVDAVNRAYVDRNFRRKQKNGS